MGDCDSRPAMEDGLAHGGDRSRIMDVRPEVRAVIYPAQDPFRVRNDFEQSKANAIRRSPMDRETLITARFDPDAFVPCHSMAHTGLRSGRGDNDGFA